MTKQEKTAILAQAGLQYIISLKHTTVPKILHEILTDIAFINNGNPRFAEICAIGATPTEIIEALEFNLKDIKEAFHTKKFIKNEL